MQPDTLLAALRSGQTPFLGLPLCLDPEPVPGVVLGAPYDGGVIHRPGARIGPWALRQATLGLGRLPMPRHLQGVEDTPRSFAAVDWVDGGNLPTRPFAIHEALEAVAQGIGAWSAQGARTLLLGGDHLMTLGALRGHARRHGALGLLVFDAHPDAATGEAWGSRFHHGTWVRRALEEGLVEPRRTVMVGLRAPRFDSEELAFLADAGVRMWTPWDLKEPRLAAQFQGDLGRLSQGPTYVSVDLDVLDPAFAPAVAEPVPGGLTPGDLFGHLRHLHRWERPWVGADVMELAHGHPGSDETARVGAHTALHLLA